MKQLAQAVLHSGNNQTEKQTSTYIRNLPKVGIIAQAWDLASTISYGISQRGNPSRRAHA
jgi:hypothetical protein